MATQKELFQSCEYRIKEEGFEYTFESYSNWEDIKDPKFQELRAAYLESVKELDSYVRQMASE